LCGDWQLLHHPKPTTLSLLIALINVAIFLGILLGVIILRSPIFKSNANKYLAYALVGLSFCLLCLAAELTDAYDFGLIIQVIDAFCSGALFPVLILFFIVIQVDHPLQHSSKRWWLVLPHVLSVALSLLDLFVDFNAISFWAQGIHDGISTLLFLLILLFIPAVLLYAYSFIKYARNKKEKRWLAQIWICFFVVMLSWVLSIFFAVFSIIDDASMIISITLGATFLIHWMTYVGIFKFKLSRDQEEIKALIAKWKTGTINPSISLSQKVQDSNEKTPVLLTEENAYFKKLESLLINDRIYLDNTLDRLKVAEKLGISPSYISQLVNKITGENFSTYINRYRVEAVKIMITNKEFDNYSLLAIGLESGFSSKTTFYTAFKKLTGMTPNVYRKEKK